MTRSAGPGADEAAPLPALDKAQISGLVLAGGRGSRMGGVDKGLQPHRGRALALHALLRLAPQVHETMISANRHLPSYEAMGVPVWPDRLPDYAGPLAGMLVGLEHATTPYVATVPCDSPDFPVDLVARLGAALRVQGAELAVACTGDAAGPRRQPVFCLLKRTLAPSLADYVAGGGRRVGEWFARHRVAEVVFDDDAAFFNANTLDELQRLQSVY